MMSTNNILSPANGKPIIVPSQYIVLGIYYLSMEDDGEPGEGMLFGDIGEIEHALASGAVRLHAKLKARYPTVDADNQTIRLVVDTTPGSTLMSSVLTRTPQVSIRLPNKALPQKELTELIDIASSHSGPTKTVKYT